MQLDGSLRVCGLIGNPVAHTISPLLQSVLAERMNINSVYAPFHVEKEALEAAVKGAFGLNILGMNVTVPYKNDVLPYLTRVDDLAARIGAVNTLVREEKGFAGYNTDMPGLYRAMCADGVSLEGKDVVLLGAGGVARAVLIMLLDKKVASITILNRSLEHANRLKEEINGLAGKELVTVLPLSDWNQLPKDRKYLVIQSTSVGMHPNVEEAVISDKEFYSLVEVGYDLVYNPAKTRFMELTEEAGGRSYNGLRMLAYQGVIAFELWNRLEVPKEVAEEAYQTIKKALDK